MQFIGIDPGENGCIGVVGTGGPSWFRLKGASERDVWDFVYQELVGSSCFALIENVWSSPQMGVASSFKFGRSLGFLRGIITAARIPFDDVTPQTWQKHMRCQTKGDKNVSKAKAQQLFPDLKITHGNADAMLIAEYCRQTRSLVQTA